MKETFSSPVDTQYFVPDIRDIRIGYECEVESNSKWIKVIINAFDSEESSIGTYDNRNFWLSAHNLRTSYLTKEQIEAEGWKMKEDIGYQEFNFYYREGVFEDEPLYNSYRFVKGNRLLKWIPDVKQIKISNGETYDDEIVCYTGPCLSINELRWISGLLRIGTSFGI